MDSLVPLIHKTQTWVQLKRGLTMSLPCSGGAD